MRVTTRFPVATLRGKAGSGNAAVLQGNNGVLSLRRHVQTPQPESANRTESQARFASVAASFSALTEDQRRLWDEYAASHPGEWEGLTIRRQAMAAFTLHNYYEEMCYGSTSLEPPTISYDTHIVDLVLAGWWAPLSRLTIVITVWNALGLGYLFYECTDALPGSNRRARGSEFRAPQGPNSASAKAITGSPVVYQTVDPLTNARVGDRIGIRARRFIKTQGLGPWSEWYTTMAAS